ncbi:MAG: hypothetical protein WCO40_01870, partial [Thermoleophilia bacterium]
AAGEPGVWFVGVLVAAITVGQILHAVFTVVVYRYATEGVTPEGFSADDLNAVFRSKKHRF